MLYRFFKEQEGATAIEYGLVVALIVVASLSAIIATGTANQKNYDKISNEVTSVTGN